MSHTALSLNGQTRKAEENPRHISMKGFSTTSSERTLGFVLSPIKINTFIKYSKNNVVEKLHFKDYTIYELVFFFF